MGKVEKNEGDRIVDGKLVDKDGKEYSVVELDSDGKPEIGFHSLEEMHRRMEEAETRLDRIWNSVCRMFYSISSIRYTLKYAFQRMARGFDERDCWNVDTSLMKYVASLVEKYAKDRHGVPNDYYDAAERKLNESSDKIDGDAVTELASKEFGKDLEKLVLNARLYLYYMSMCVEDPSDGTVGFEEEYPCPHRIGNDGVAVIDYGRIDELRKEAKNAVLDYLRDHLESLWD